MPITKRCKPCRRPHDQALRDFDSSDLLSPPELERRVRERITDTTDPWDEGLWQIVSEDEDDQQTLDEDEAC